VPALNEDLHGAEFFGFIDLLANLFERQDISFWMFRPSIESAKFAVSNTYVRVIDVAINYVRYNFLRMQLPSVQGTLETHARCGQP
jgi:hypothetical protein